MLAEFWNERNECSLNISRLISDAREMHTRNPNDIAHDWIHHHVPVIKNVIQIAKRESDLRDVDMPVVLVASAWHDYKRHSGDFSDMEHSLYSHGANRNFVEKVKNTISEHSHSSERKTPNGVMLWAADKIEYVSKDRYVASLSNMSSLKVFAYQTMWKVRLPKVIEELKACCFQSAKDIFDSKLKDLIGHIRSSNPKDLIWFEGL